LSNNDKRGIEERFFDDGSVPAPDGLKKAAKMKAADEKRPEPFQGKTLPHAELTVHEYGLQINEWFARVTREKKAPNREQLVLLERVRERVLLELRLFKEGDGLNRGNGGDDEEPLRAIIHGAPGTGKSALIQWMRRFFSAALGWEHGVEFMCVAFQNRVVHAMDGTTLHAGGDVQVGGQSSSKLSHSDIDNLFIRNQQLRWVIVEEVGMIADDLLGASADHLADAAIRNCRYRKRRNGSERIIVGYNLCMFGNLFQLPPIPSSGAICIPPGVKKTEQAKLALNMFWGDDADSINYFVELDEQM
jgi:hypothetical protein